MVYNSSCRLILFSKKSKLPKILNTTTSPTLWSEPYLSLSLVNKKLKFTLISHMIIFWSIFFPNFSRHCGSSAQTWLADQFRWCRLLFHFRPFDPSYCRDCPLLGRSWFHVLEADQRYSHWTFLHHRSRIWSLRIFEPDDKWRRLIAIVLCKSRTFRIS